MCGECTIETTSLTIEFDPTGPFIAPAPVPADIDLDAAWANAPTCWQAAAAGLSLPEEGR